MNGANPDPRRESGFTLIELLVCVVILGIIAVPLSMALFSYFKNSDTTAARINESSQVQITSSYFARDVSLMGLRDFTASHYPGGVMPQPPPLPPFLYRQSVWAATTAGGSVTYTPPPPSTCGTLSGALIIGGDDYSSDVTTPAQFYVAYRLVGTDLHRIRCAGPTRTDTVIARDVTRVAAPTCSSECGATPPPAAVELSLTVRIASGSPGDYGVTLTGSRSQTMPSGGGGAS